MAASSVLTCCAERERCMGNGATVVELLGEGGVDPWLLLLMLLPALALL